MPVALQQLLVIHPVELVPRQDQLIVLVTAAELVEMLADGVGRALEPVRILHRLFGGEHFNEAFIEGIEPKAVRDVPIK